MGIIIQTAEIKAIQCISGRIIVENDIPISPFTIEIEPFEGVVMSYITVGINPAGIIYIEANATHALDRTTRSAANRTPLFCDKSPADRIAKDVAGYE
jgi:hypothetical protein